MLPVFNPVHTLWRDPNANHLPTQHGVDEHMEGAYAEALAALLLQQQVLKEAAWLQDEDKDDEHVLEKDEVLQDID